MKPRTRTARESWLEGQARQDQSSEPPFAPGSEAEPGTECPSAECEEELPLPCGLGAALSLPRRHQTSSGASSVTTIPGTTMNLQESMGRASSSSGNRQVTRQYWHS